MKKTLLIGAAALALAGCAAGPYPDGYGYGPSYYGYGGAPAYYDYGPSFGVGYYYYDGGGNRHWHDGHDNNWRDPRNDWRDGNNNGRDGRNDWRGDRNWDRTPQSTHQLEPGPMDSRPAAQTGGVRSYHGEMGNEAGMGGRGGGYSQQ